MTVLEFLSSDSNRPPVPDGRPLYAYRCLPEEREQLCQQLKVAFRLHRPNQLSDQTCAFLCLYVAEWIRSEYHGGAWSWDGPLNSLGRSLGSSLQPLDLYDLISRGLLHWKRPLLRLREQRRYLMTLVAEGGLPLGMLKQEGSRLQRFFFSVLQYLQTHFYSGIEPMEQLAVVAEQYKTLLPDSLQQPEVWGLMGHLAGKVWSLREDLGGWSVGDPLTHLDRQRPDWRNELPLVVEEEVARDLLLSLFSQVKELTRAGPAQVRIETLLTLQNEDTHLKRKLIIPACMEPEQFQRVFDRASDEVPPRLTVRLVVSETSRSVSMGILQRRQGAKGDYWTFERSGSGLEGAEVLGEIRLEASGGGMTLVNTGLAGATRLGGLPWVFRQEEGQKDTWRLVAIGSCRSQASELLVAVEPLAECREHPGTRLEMIADPMKFGRKFYRLAGELNVSHDGGNVRICTGQSDSEEGNCYSLVGASFGVGNQGETIWRGMPRLFQTTSKGIIREINKQELRFKGQTGPWQLDPCNVCGRVRVRHLKQDQVQGELEVSWVPPDFEITSRVGEGTAKGCLSFKSMALKDVGVEDATQRSWIAGSSRKTGGCEILFGREHRPPASVTVSVRFVTGTVHLTLPYPQRSAAFLHPDGRELTRDAWVALDRLDLIRAHAVDQGGTHYTLNARLFSKTPNSLETSFALRSDGPGEHSLPLREIQDSIALLLTCSRELEAYVLLELLQPGARESTRIKIRRYDHALQADKSSGQVSLPQCDGLQGAIQVDAINLSSSKPELGPLPAAPHSDSGALSWTFDRPHSTGKRRAPGAWLVLARTSAGGSIRPLLWPVPERLRTGFSAQTKSASGTGEVYSLAEACKEAEPRLRLEKLQAHLRRMGTDPGHPDWKVLKYYLELSESLPPVTFDVLPALTQAPQTVALTALMATPAELSTLWRILERLPFMWELVSKCCWKEAIQHYQTHLDKVLRELGDGGMLARETVFTSIRRIGERLPTVWHGAVEWLRQNDASHARDTPKDLLLGTDSRLLEALAGCLRGEQQALRNRHKDEEWPQLKALQPLPSLVSAEIRNRLPRDYWADESKGTGFRNPILNAPLLAAVAAVYNESLNDTMIYFLREFKAFDEHYFVQAYRMAVAQLVNRGFVSPKAGKDCHVSFA